jgi:hypothetical protein
MDNAEAIRALEYVQRYFDKQAIDYMDESLETIRNHLTDPGYVRVPVVMTESLRSVYQNDNGAYQSAEDFHAAMLAATKETSHD